MGTSAYPITFYILLKFQVAAIIIFQTIETKSERERTNRWTTKKFICTIVFFALTYYICLLKFVFISACVSHKFSGNLVWTSGSATLTVQTAADTHSHTENLLIYFQGDVRVWFNHTICNTHAWIANHSASVQSMFQIHTIDIRYLFILMAFSLLFGYDEKKKTKRSMCTEVVE